MSEKKGQEKITHPVSETCCFSVTGRGIELPQFVHGAPLITRSLFFHFFSELSAVQLKDKEGNCCSLEKAWVRRIPDAFERAKLVLRKIAGMCLVVLRMGEVELRYVQGPVYAKGNKSMNPRLRGKIPHSEWPRIAESFAAGETFTQIARRYGCTAPAIRYIVKRQPLPGDRRKLSGDRRERLEHGSRLSEERLFSTPDSAGSADTLEGRHTERAPTRGSSLPETFWARVSSDIAGFLAAMDGMIVDGNEKTEAALLTAADRLLRVSALTRLEIERIRSSRQGSLRVVR